MKSSHADNDNELTQKEKTTKLKNVYKDLELSHQKLQILQDHLVKSGKMAALGSLAAGVAHEINNPLGAINSAADVSMRAIEKIELIVTDNQKTNDPKNLQKFEDLLKILHDNIRLIALGSTRILKIVKSLKTFTRPDEIELQEANIHEGLDNTLTLLQHEIKNRITVEKHYGNIPPVNCYPNELSQVFMNILANAVQAIEKKGIIRIRTFTKGDHLCIEIEDTGRGISPDNLEKIFDPGFTTKSVGMGTGIGLSISHKIMEKHNGQILVKSKEGKGSIFTLVIPLDLDK